MEKIQDDIMNVESARYCDWYYCTEILFVACDEHDDRRVDVSDFYCHLHCFFCGCCCRLFLQDHLGEINV
jgi:hypothetical protein